MTDPQPTPTVHTAYAADPHAAAVTAAFAEVDAARREAEAALADTTAAGPAALTPGADATGPNTPGTDLAMLPAAGDAAAVKARAAAVHARAHTARATLAAAQQKAKDAVAAQQQALTARLAEQMAALEPLQKQVNQAKEAIWTINLYLGRDEVIVPLVTGTPAPADTPLVIRQTVLAMDEETAARAETGGIDVRSINEFDTWITDPANLDQVLPEARGVVAIMPRRTERDYGDPWANQALNEANAETWFLLRNGQNVYRMLTEFSVGKRLVPTRDEFTSLFIDRWTKRPMQPGSTDWMRAEAAAGARERHYMRIALILQGLLDRTEVFAPAPTPPLSLLSMADYDSGRVRLLTDAENVLTDGRPPFYQWLAAKNSLLTVGMRVIINARHADFPMHENRWSGSPRIHPARASLPPAAEALTITRRAPKGGFVATYARTDTVWGRYESHTAKTPASVTFYPTDRFVLPVDLVDTDEMRTYLASRTDRHAYEAMFPTLRAAIAFREAEAATEAPFRALLASAIATAENLDLDAATAVLDPVIASWKIGNRWHRPLSGDPQAEAKAMRHILAERARISRAQDNASTDRDTQIIAAVRAEHPEVLLVARRKNGAYLALVPQSRRWARPTAKERNTYGDQVAPVNVFTTLLEFTATGRPKATTEWYIPSPAQVTRWITLYEGPRWAGWNKQARAAEHLTDPQIEALLDQILATDNPTGTPVAVTYREDPRDWGYRSHRFIAYYHPHNGPTAESDAAIPALTGEHTTPRLPAWEFWAARDGDNWVLRTDRHTDGHHNLWHVQHNTRLDGTRVGTIEPEWVGDRRANHIIWTDEQVLATARAQAEAWNTRRAARAALREESRRLADGLEHAFVAQAREAARLRHIEDYGSDEHFDATDYETSRDGRSGSKAHAPWRYTGDNAKGYRETGNALAHLTNRLVEQGRAPYGLTVAEAIDSLGEPLPNRRMWVAAGGQGSWVEGDGIPDDVRTLRYPPPRPAIDD